MALDNYLLLAIVTSLIVCSLSISDDVENTRMELQQKLESFEEYVNSVMACRKVPSGAVVLIKDKQVLMSKGFGMKDREKGVHVTGSSKFPIGSLTKAFTSTLLALLLEENQK